MGERYLTVLGLGKMNEKERRDSITLENMATPVWLAKKPRLVMLLVIGAIVAASCGQPTPVPQSAGEFVARDSGATRPLELTAPEATPPVDQSLASVELADIVFDTFNGGSITLAEASQDDIDRLFDAIPPIDSPGYETVAEADWLTGDAVILGYEDPTGGAWAYPILILDSHEIVNDELGGQPVLISYCPLCGSGVVYDRTLNGQELSFSNTSALLDNDMVMVDRETGSYWWQVAGSAVVGELNEENLVVLPSQTTRLSSWVEQFPDTLIMERPAGRSYDRNLFASYGEVLASGRTPFPVRTDVLGDDRLASEATVVYVSVDEETVAWNPAPARSFSDEIAGVEVEVVTDGLGAVVTADGEPLPTRSSFWFAALTVFPDIVLSTN